MGFRQSMNSFRWPGVGGINTESICWYVKVSFGSFKMSSNVFFLNCLCYTWSNTQHLVVPSMALFSQSLTLPNNCAFILSKLVIALRGFPRLGAAWYPETPHKHTQSKLTDLHEAWYAVPQYREYDSRSPKVSLLFPSHQEVGECIISCISK